MRVRQVNGWGRARKQRGKGGQHRRNFPNGPLASVPDDILNYGVYGVLYWLNREMSLDWPPWLAKASEELLVPLITF